MKTLLIALFCLCFLSINLLFAQVTPAKTDNVDTIKAFKNLYRYQNFYLGAQPSYEELQWLKSKGINTVINLRSIKENQDYAAAAYNEDSAMVKMGFTYHPIPVDGIKDHTPAKLDEMARILTSDKPVFIHCAGGGRVISFFMAYLIKYRNYEVDEAIKIGKMLSFSLPLENLLDTKISMKALPK